MGTVVDGSKRWRTQSPSSRCLEGSRSLGTVALGLSLIEDFCPIHEILIGRTRRWQERMMTEYPLCRQLWIRYYRRHHQQKASLQSCALDARAR